MSGLELRLSGVRHRHPGLPTDTPAATSFTLAPGEQALLVGPSGAGKSTLLLRTVGLLWGPGGIALGGEPLTPAHVRRLRQRIGLLWQDPDDGLLLPTPEEDVAFGPVNDGVPDAEAKALAREWLDRLGLTHLAKRPLAALSQGEKQLVAMAGLLARRPGLLLLDEPTAHLDPVSRARLAGVLREVDATVLLVTHTPEQWAGEPRFGRILSLGG